MKQKYIYIFCCMLLQSGRKQKNGILWDSCKLACCPHLCVHAMRLAATWTTLSDPHWFSESFTCGTKNIDRWWHLNGRYWSIAKWWCWVLNNVAGYWLWENQSRVGDCARTVRGLPPLLARSYFLLFFCFLPDCSSI